MATTTTEYLPPALSFLIANFSSFVTEKLDSTNYFAWKTQIENALLANSLFEYANGTITIPAVELRDEQGNTRSNPEFKHWETIDRMLMSCIIATVSSSLLPHLVGSKRTCEVWSRMEEKFSSLSRTHIHDLKCRIYNLKKTTTMEQYIDSIKVLVQKLEATGASMDDEELVFHTLKGLPNEQYRSFKQAIQRRFESSPITFHGLASMLLAEDLYLDSDPVETTTILLTQHNSSPASVPSKMNSSPSIIPQTQLSQNQQYCPTFNVPISSYGGNNFGGQRNNRNGNNFGGNRNNRTGNRNNFSQGFSFPAGACQICGRTNHQAYTCYYRQNLNYKPPQYVTNTQFSTQGMQSPQNSQFVPQGAQYGYSVGAQHSQSSAPAQVFMVSPDFGANHHEYSPQSHGPQQQGFYLHTQQQVPSSSYTGGHAMASNGGAIYPSASVPLSHPNYGVFSASSPANSVIPTATPAVPWYFDTGASAHVTNNTNQISVPIPQGPTQVTVGNGQSVPVSHSGLFDQPSGPSGVLQPGPLSPSSLF